MFHNRNRRRKIRRRFALIAAAATCAEMTEVNRSCWIKPWLREHYNQGAFPNLLQFLRRNDSDAFRNYLRMDHICFEDLLKRIGPLIEKQDTNYRRAIPADERLAITLRFLASGKHLSLAYFV